MFLIWVTGDDVQEIRLDPGPQTKSAKDRYIRIHKGVHHHREPLLPIEPMKRYICILHLQLSMTKLLWMEFIVEHVHSEHEATRLQEKLESIHIKPK